MGADLPHQQPLLLPGRRFQRSVALSSVQDIKGGAKTYHWVIATRRSSCPRGPLYGHRLHAGSLFDDAPLLMTGAPCGLEGHRNWTKEYRHQPTSSEQTLAQRREHPYIWTTWLPRLLTGENSCEWAIWFKAHHQNWDKVPSGFNQAQWMLNYTSPLNTRLVNWEVGGYSVGIEG